MGTRNLDNGNNNFAAYKEWRWWPPGFTWKSWTIDGNGGDDTLIGGEKDDTIFGDDGNDWINGKEGNDVLNGGFDHDSLHGGMGNDTIDGAELGGCDDFVVIDVDSDVEVHSSALCLGPNGQYEYDNLTGDEGADVFVLGNGFNPYYNNDNFGGYAIITDFNWQEGDQIQVSGNIADYSLTPYGGGMDIYYQSDLIGWVTNTTDVLLSDDFIFV